MPLLDKKCAVALYSLQVQKYANKCDRSAGLDGESINGRGPALSNVRATYAPQHQTFDLVKTCSSHRRLRHPWITGPWHATLIPTALPALQLFPLFQLAADVVPKALLAAVQQLHAPRRLHYLAKGHSTAESSRLSGAKLQAIPSITAPISSLLQAAPR